MTARLPPCHCDKAPPGKSLRTCTEDSPPSRGDEHFQNTDVGERSSSISTVQPAALCLLLCEPTPPQACDAVWISLCLSRKERIPPAWFA